MDLPEYSLDSYKVIAYLNDKLLGETESQEGVNINFSTPFSFDYFFEAAQNLKIELIPSNKIKKYEEKFDLQKMMRLNKKEERSIYINDAKDLIKIIILCETSLSSTHDIYENYRFYNIRFINVPNSDQRKLLFEFYSQRDNTYWRPLYHSETSINTVNPNFKEFSLRRDYVSNFNKETPIKFVIFEQDKGLVGEAKTSIKTLSSSVHTYIYDSSSKQIGSIQVEFEPFRDLAQKELFESLKFFSTVAMDFTESNVQPSNVKSLHYINHEEGAKLNPYQDAIMNMDRLLTYFNSTMLIPFYGFGAFVPGGSSVEFCCDLYNFYAEKQHIIGVSGVLKVYGEIVGLMKFSGPTNLSPLFSHIVQTYFPSPACNPYNYHILWILIDGDIDDQANAEESLKEAYNHGLSVIICGVGNAKFELMNQFSKGLLK